jgi:hypothetical protein
MKEISQGDLNLTSAKPYFSTKKTNICLLRGKNISKYKIINNAEEYGTFVKCKNISLSPSKKSNIIVSFSCEKH